MRRCVRPFCISNLFLNLQVETAPAAAQSSKKPSDPSSNLVGSVSIRTLNVGYTAASTDSFSLQSQSTTITTSAAEILLSGAAATIQHITHVHNTYVINKTVTMDGAVFEPAVSALRFLAGGVLIFLSTLSFFWVWSIIASLLHSLQRHVVHTVRSTKWWSKGSGKGEEGEEDDRSNDYTPGSDEESKPDEEYEEDVEDPSEDKDEDGDDRNNSS